MGMGYGEGFRTGTEQGRGKGEAREGDAGSPCFRMEIAVSKRPGSWRWDENKKISNTALKKNCR